MFKANKINSFYFEKTNETLSGYDSLKRYSKQVDNELILADVCDHFIGF